MAIRDPLRAIRKKCLECSGGDKNEVASCELVDCPLHPFRMGDTIKQNGIPVIPPAPRAKKTPAQAVERASGNSEDVSKEKKQAPVSTQDQYTLF